MCLGAAAALGAAALVFFVVIVVLSAAEMMEPTGPSPVGSVRATLRAAFPALARRALPQSQ
tara:strand:- start:190 stop:372 length:183 start_codon:yes stop_codon:yes gene_type:complete